MIRRNVDIEDDMGLSSIKVAETKEEKEEARRKREEYHQMALKRIAEMEKENGRTER